MGEYPLLITLHKYQSFDMSLCRIAHLGVNRNKMNTSDVLFKMAIGIILTFCCVPVIVYSQSDEIHGLIQALNDKNVNIRRRAIRALEKVGPSAVKPLIAALKSEKSRARAGAAEALGKIKDARAVEPLIDVLRDNISNVRAAAAEALGEIKDARAVVPLIALLQDIDSDVRSWAAKALGEIKDARAVEPIIAALQDENANVRSWAAEALGEIKDSRAIEPLIAALQDISADVRNSAAKALAKIKPAT